MSDLWQGLRPSARQRLVQRDYTGGSANSSVTPLSALELSGLDRSCPDVREVWIPGVEICRRTIYPQRFRGSFGELGRQDQGLCGQVGLWPRQWAVARMFAGTAKGFHVHPPSIPDGQDPEVWFRKLFVESPDNYSLRRYEFEQWDLMFVVCGVGEMILVDERAGLPRRLMRFFIEADDKVCADSTGVLIPPGVAHAIRVEGSSDLVMVYGTSVTFKAEAEGRIASGVEMAGLPSEWADYLQDL